MFRITGDPSPGSLVQCLAKNCKKDSVVSVDMDKVSVMAAYSVCSSLYIKAHNTSLYTELHTQYAAITPTMSMPTHTTEPFL